MSPKKRLKEEQVPILSQMLAYSKIQLHQNRPRLATPRVGIPTLKRTHLLLAKCKYKKKLHLFSTNRDFVYKTKHL